MAMYQPLVGFKPRKAAQMSAFFTQNNPSKEIEKLKLIKLIYLAEREFLFRHNIPMLFDEFYSLPHGPICSNTLNCINGDLDGCDKYWDSYLTTENRSIRLKNDLDRSDFDEISKAEYEVLCFVWKKFGSMSSTEIRKYTHDHCSEYDEVESGSRPISYKSVFQALGSGDDATDLADNIDEMRRIETLFQA